MRGELGEIVLTINQPGPIRAPPGFGPQPIFKRGDVADDGFQHVHKRDEPDRAAIRGTHHGELHTGAFEMVLDVEHRFVRRDEKRCGEKIDDARRRSRSKVGIDGFHRDHADDMIPILRRDRVSRMTGHDDFMPQRFLRFREVHEDQLGAWRHDFPHRPPVKGEHRLDHARLFLEEDAAFPALAQKQPHFVVRNGIRLARLHAQPDVGRAAEQMDDWLGDATKQLAGSG